MFPPGWHLRSKARCGTGALNAYGSRDRALAEETDADLASPAVQVLALSYPLASHRLRSMGPAEPGWI